MATISPSARNISHHRPLGMNRWQAFKRPRFFTSASSFKARANNRRVLVGPCHGFLYWLQQWTRWGFRWSPESSTTCCSHFAFFLTPQVFIYLGCYWAIFLSVLLAFSAHQKTRPLRGIFAVLDNLKRNWEHIRLRILTYIFVAYLLVLSVQPCSDSLIPRDNQGHTIERTAYADRSSQEINADYCSPFCICSCCGQPVPTIAYYLPFVVTAETELVHGEFSLYTSPYQSHLTYSIWQPPKA